MIRAAIGFFLIGLLAFTLGAYNIAGLSIELGKMLLLVFIVLAIISFLVKLTTGKRTKDLI
jgi:uncharacterized membrane protein YtjA (UPF0391 family)